MTSTFQSTMPTLSPRLVDATSTRSLGAPKPLDPAQYYHLRSVPPSNFSVISSWDKFDFMVRRNLSRIDDSKKTDIKIRNPKEVAQIIIEPMFEENGIEAGFFYDDEKLLGHSDFILRASTSGRPLLLCREVSDAEVSLALWSELLDHAKSDSTLQSLCGTLLLNACPLGLIASPSFARFVSISSGSRGLELRISNPIASRDLGLVFLAVCLEAVFELPHFQNEGLNVAVETLPEPDIQPLSSYEAGISGRIKWWVADQMSKRSFRLYFDKVAPANAGWDLDGQVTITMNRCQASEPAVFKISQGDKEELRKEASVYEYLASQKPPILVPRRIFYGHLQGGVQVLALEPFGRRMTADDITPHISRHMRRVVSAVNAAGLMHGSISLESFYVDNSGVVRLADFGEAKLYRRLPEIARQQEIQDLEEALLSRKSSLD